MNSVSYKCCKSPDVTIRSVTVTNCPKAPAVCLQDREVNSEGEERFIVVIPTDGHASSRKLII
jgi:hypothetical protein